MVVLIKKPFSFVFNVIVVVVVGTSVLEISHTLQTSISSYEKIRRMEMSDRPWPGNEWPSDASWIR